MAHGIKEKTRTVTRFLFATALLLGTIAVGWISSVFVDTNVLALAVTLVIGGVYSIGAVELIQFRNATASLWRALSATPERVEVLDAWLDQLDTSLRVSVRLRIEGERVGLPAPILTPYLIGLLVMLGLLGTFIGMVDTLRGAVIALEGAAEIQAIREGLAAPIRGLGLAFGTSVAGVATSAMLGLMSTLSRRDRILACRHLDTQAARAFQDFSLAHHQRETFRAIQTQSRALPEVVDRMAAVAGRLDHLGDQLVAHQDRFHATVKTMYAQLAASVDASHKENLRDSIRLAGEHIQPLLQEAVAGIAAETHKGHGMLIANMSASLESFRGQCERMAESLLTSLGNSTASWIERQMETVKETLNELTTHALTTSSRMHQEITGLLTSSQDLIRTRMITEAAWLERHSDRMDALTAALKAELGALREDEERRGQAAVERLATLEATLASHLTTLGKEIENTMNRLIQTAASVPLAAADVISRLREEASKSVERDNRLLEEHHGILTQLDTLSRALAVTSTQQHEAIDQLVGSSRRLLEDITGRFTEHVSAETSNFSRVSESFAVSAVEMASLGESFSAAVQVFNTANETLVDNLGRIEQSLDKTASRSDEQLAYYVAQARQIVDHCMLSQKEIFEELQHLRPQNHVNPETGEWKN